MNRAARRCLVEWTGLAISPAATAMAEHAVELALAGDRLRKRSLCVLVVDDAGSARLHDAHFADPTPTDVMSFPDGAEDPASGLIRLGDLAVCLDVARRVAGKRGRPVEEEIALYVLHGALHLLGHDDVEDADREAMWAVQRAVMAKMGITID